MNKKEFLAELRRGLSALPEEDIERSLEYYSEMIDDRTEDGLSEEEAVAAVGSVGDIVSQILAESASVPPAREKGSVPRSFKAWEIVLLILGSPVWLPLLLAAVIVVAAVYIALWSVVISMYAIDFSIAACGIAGMMASVAYIPFGKVAAGVLFIGAGLVCLGISILLFLAFDKVTRGICFLSKKIFLGIVSCFGRKAGA